MIWSAVGNKWLDDWIVKAMNFSGELESSACYNSPLDSKDREDLKKCMVKLNKINQRVNKRVTKLRKKK